MLSRFLIAFLPRSKHLLISVTVTIHIDFGAQENKICHCFHFFPFYLREVMKLTAVILSFFNVEFQVGFFMSSFTLIKRLFSSS